MKFGKKIRTEAVGEWADYYVDYKDLKHQLKPIVGTTKSEEEDAFSASVLAEIEKVDKFFIQTENELYADFRLLCQQVANTHLEVSKDSCSSLDKLFLAHQGTPAGQLIKDFLSLSAKVDRMRKFVMMNTLAVIKITKKHDKHNQRQLQSEMVAAVHKRHFYSSSRFGTLITDIEVLATQIMSRLTQAHPLAENYSCPICLGIRESLCNPVVLSCGHRFCMKCVSAASYFCQTSCPVCRKEQILDLETIKVDTLLSHFLDRYFPEGQSGVKQCQTCASRPSTAPLPSGRSRMPCEECNLSLLETLGKMQSATISQYQREAVETRQCAKATTIASQRAAAHNKTSGGQGSTSESQNGSGGGDSRQASGHQGKGVGHKRTELSMEEFDMEVRPRLKRRSVGAGGRQALGGRPHLDEDAQAPPILLNAAMLRAHFNLPLNEAAKKLGVCATAIKKVCRKIGIKQWPHRKLKAVEKRLALLQTEHRYCTDEGDKVQHFNEINELEEKRKLLMQGEDCDISFIGGATSKDGTPGRSRTPLPPASGSAHDASMSIGAAHSCKSEGHVMETDQGAFAPHMQPEGRVEMQQGHQMQSHGMMEAVHIAMDGTQAEEDSEDILKEEDESDESVAATNQQKDITTDGSSMWAAPMEAEDDVWEMLHQMMDEPTTDPSMLLQAQGTHFVSQAHSSLDDYHGANVNGDGGDKDVMRHRIASLEEEVLNLRQFTMTLIKERGDLAMQIQDRDAEIQELRAQNEELQCEMLKLLPDDPRSSSSTMAGSSTPSKRLAMSQVASCDASNGYFVSEGCAPLANGADGRR